MRALFILFLFVSSLIKINAQRTDSIPEIVILKSEFRENYYYILGRIICSKKIKTLSIKVNNGNKEFILFDSFNRFEKEVRLESGNNDIEITAESVEGFKSSIGFGFRQTNVYNETYSLPKFPWPPPKASAIEVLPSKAFSKCKNYFDVDEVIDIALTNNGYYDKSYYALKPIDSIIGYAIATRLEQINKDASSKKVPNRWKTKVEMNDFEFSEYLSSIFFTQTGYFRVIVFIITDKPIKQTKKTVKREIALSWVSDGVHLLPSSIRNRPFTEKHSVTALIYEYELTENSNKATLHRPSEHTGREHLIKSNLWKAFME